MEIEKEVDYCRHLTGSFDSRFVLKGSLPQYAPDRTFDTEHIRLALNVDLFRDSLQGNCQTKLRAICDNPSSMTFDAVNFKIHHVKWNGKKVPYDYKDGRLKISLKNPIKAGSLITVDIAYHISKPKLGIYFIKPNRQYPHRPWQVWTQGEDEYARYWFPCHDAPHERTTTEMIATVPKGFLAVSNGRLLRTIHNARKKISIFHWTQKIPHAPYLVTLAVGRFSVIKDHWKKISVHYYCEKGREEDAKRAFSRTPLMMDFFSNFIRTPYPYPKYAQIAVADFIYGGMENTSATTQTDSALLDQRVMLDYSSDELVAHELAHQWFGDFLTCKDWSQAWLNESFATYFDALFKRFDKGEEEFLLAIHRNSEAYFLEDKEHYRRPIVTRIFKRPTDLFDRHLYEKGSVVLYMLHRLLGEDLFRKSIGTYVRKNKGGVVETGDLINAIEEATGRNVRRFFDQWVYGAGHPEFKIRSWWDNRKKEIHLRVTQSHTQGNNVGLFHVQTEFLFLTKKGEKRIPVTINEKSHHFQFPLDSEPHLILFDPNQSILKKVDFPKTESMWIVQLEKDKDPIGRMEAAQALAKLGSHRGLKALKLVLLSDKFWGVQAEVARAIGSMNLEESETTLLHSLDVIEHPKVRRAIYGALRGFKSKKVAVEIEKRYKSEDSYFVEAEALHLLGALRHPRAADLLREALHRDSWNDLIRSAALEGLTATRSRDWIPLLLSYTRPGHSQKLRMTAIRCLAQFEPGVTSIQNRLLELTKDSFLLVRLAAIRALHQIGDERVVPTLKKLTAGDWDGRLKRLAEEAIEKITKGFEGS